MWVIKFYDIKAFFHCNDKDKSLCHQKLNKTSKFKVGSSDAMLDASFKCDCYEKQRCNHDLNEDRTKMNTDFNAFQQATTSTGTLDDIFRNLNSYQILFLRFNFLLLTNPLFYDLLYLFQMLTYEIRWLTWRPPHLHERRENKTLCNF